MLTLLLGLTGFFAFGHSPSFHTKSTEFSFQQSGSDSLVKTVKRKENKRAHIATVMSAVLPGAGQVYNRKYWKPPVIYAAFAGLGYLFLQNNNKYQQYRHALIYRYDENPATLDSYPNYTDDNLITLKTQYRKYRDLAGIGIAIVYVFNVVDANVDGHLYKFDQKISDDVSMSIKPYNTVTLNNRFQLYSGLTVQFKIR